MRKARHAEKIDRNSNRRAETRRNSSFALIRIEFFTENEKESDVLIVDRTTKLRINKFENFDDFVDRHVDDFNGIVVLPFEEIPEQRRTESEKNFVDKNFFFWTLKKGKRKSERKFSFLFISPWTISVKSENRCGRKKNSSIERRSSSIFIRFLVRSAFCSAKIFFVVETERNIFSFRFSWPK